LGQEALWGAKILKGAKIVTLFFNIVWPIAMKFGATRGWVLKDFGELWCGDPAVPRGDMYQSFTDAVV